MKQLSKQPRLDVFLFDGNVLVTDEDEGQHLLGEDQYPVTLLFECVDFGDGNGWGRHHVEKHGEVLEFFRCNVGPGHTNYAVLCEFDSKEALVAACKVLNPEFLDHVPEAL